MRVTTRMTHWGQRVARLGMTAGLLAGAVACTSNSASAGSASALSSASPSVTEGFSSAAAPSSSAASPSAPISVAEPSRGAAPASSPAAATTPSALTLTTTPSPIAPPKSAAAVVASPAFGSSDLSPTTPISIDVKDGKIKTITVVNPAGKAVTGKLSADAASWTLGEDLGYGKTYTVQGTAVGDDGKSVAITGTYSTLTPGDTAGASISPGDGDVVGVAAPVIVRFSSDPTSHKAAIQKRMKVLTTPAVQGSWAWITHDGDSYPSLDWRPKVYWPQFTKVHVAADVYGTKFSSNVFGAADVTSDFTIGRNQVVIADAKKYDIVVQRSGKTVATYPGSYGMGDDPKGRYGINPELVTRSGIHIVMTKKQTVSMSNPKDSPSIYVGLTVCVR